MRKSAILALILVAVGIGITLMLQKLKQQAFADWEAAEFAKNIAACEGDLKVGDTATFRVRLHGADMLVHILPYVGRDELGKRFSDSLSNDLYLIARDDRSAPALVWVRGDKVIASSGRLSSFVGGKQVFVWKGNDTVAIVIQKVTDTDGRGKLVFRERPTTDSPAINDRTK